jgi:hypothetical protein
MVLSPAEGKLRGEIRAFAAPLEQIAREHPEYGVRRTSVELREVYG